MQRPNAVPVTRSKTCLLLSIGVPAGCSSSSISMTSATVFTPLPCCLPAATLATTAAAGSELVAASRSLSGDLHLGLTSHDKNLPGEKLRPMFGAQIRAHI